jgi:hypothetical protein
MRRLLPAKKSKISVKAVAQHSHNVLGMRSKDGSIDHELPLFAESIAKPNLLIRSKALLLTSL